MSFSRGSFPPRNQTPVSCIAGRFFTDTLLCHLNGNPFSSSWLSPPNPQSSGLTQESRDLASRPGPTTRQQNVCKS